MNYWEDFQQKFYKKDAWSLLVEFLDKRGDEIKTAIDLGCGSGNDAVYMVKKGIKVLAIDKVLNKNYILDRLSLDEQKNIELLKANFEDVSLPKVDLVTAFFSLPFCSPGNFDTMWQKIYDSINDNGYLVCQLFGNRDFYKTIENLNLVKVFSKDEIDKLLVKYKTIRVKEVERIREIDGRKMHFFTIVAKKER